MTSTRRAAQVALGVLALALAGCTGGGATPTATPTATSPSAVSSPPGPSVSVPTTSPEDAAAAKAEEVLRAYFRAQTQCLADPPNTPITCFDNVAIGTELKNMRNTLVSAQVMVTKVSGDITVVSVDREGVDLTNRVTETPPTVPTVTFNVCVDVSNYNIVDKDGKSVVPADRKPRSRVEVSVYDYKYPDASQWRVGYVVVPKDPTC